MPNRPPAAIRLAITDRAIMTNALRLGIAGLGTVGTGVLDIIKTHEAMLTTRAGMPVKVTGVSARSKGKTRGKHDLSSLDWFDDPVALAKSKGIDVFIELIGGDTGPAKEAVEAAIASAHPPKMQRVTMIILH